MSRKVPVCSRAGYIGRIRSLLPGSCPHQGLWEPSQEEGGSLALAQELWFWSLVVGEGAQALWKENG